MLYLGFITLPRSVVRRQTGFAARITRTLSCLKEGLLNLNTFKRLFLPISISAIAYGVLFGIVDILLTGGFAQGLESQGVGVLLIAFPMAGALFSIVALSCLTILGTLSRLLKPENRWKHLAEFVVGALSMLLSLIHI